MNKQELIAKIARRHGHHEDQCGAAVDSFFDGITKSLKKGQPITFVGFGTFKTAQRKARTARNPQTGAAIKIPKRRVVRFTAGKALKTARQLDEIRARPEGHEGGRRVRLLSRLSPRFVRLIFSPLW